MIYRDIHGRSDYEEMPGLIARPAKRSPAQQKSPASTSPYFFFLLSQRKPMVQKQIRIGSVTITGP